MNSTLIHETYDAPVFKLKWEPAEVADVLSEVLDDTDILFLNQTGETTRTGIQLA